MKTMKRRQRKSETRARLVDAAAALFTEQGYEETTLADVAELADLHVQTLFRHFPTKGDLMAGVWRRSLEDFEVFFHARETSALAAWRGWVERNASQTEPKHFLAFAYRLPAISGEAQECWYRYREVLAEGIADDMGIDAATDLRPTLVACMLFAGNNHVAQSWRSRRFDKDAYVASLLEVVDTAEAMLGEAIGRG